MNREGHHRQRIQGTVIGLLALLPGLVILVAFLLPQLYQYAVAALEGETASLESKKVLVSGVLGLLFSVTGVFFIWLGWRHIPDNPRGEKPIASSERQGFVEYGFMGFAFLLLGSPFAAMAPERVANGNWAFLLVLMFPLVGLYCTHLAWKTWRNWRFYGPAPLSLDPAPGQVGGDIGGRVLLSHCPESGDWLATLKCSKRDPDQSSNRNPLETVLWQQDQVPQLRQLIEGATKATELLFCFEPPEDLPASGLQGRDEIVWRLLLKGSGSSLPLERSYQFPVTEGTARSGIALDEAHVSYHERQGHLHAITEASEQIDVRQEPKGVVLHSRIGRHLGMKLQVLLFGAAFGGFGLWMFQLAEGKGAFFYLFGGLFLLIGLPLVIGGVFMMGRSLMARINGSKVTVVRYWLGVPLWRRRANLTHADQLVFHGGLSTDGQGNRRSKDYLALAVKDSGRKIRVAEGLVGEPTAEAFRAHLAKLLGLEQG